MQSVTRIRARSMTCAAASLLLFVAGWNTQAQTEGEPSREPVLRIETGRHTSGIRRMSVDAANRFLVTVSGDKSLRVWELPAGRLRRVIHPPIGKGEEGRLSGVAVSPDGKTIAAAGWTSVEWTKLVSIYIFDLETGKLLRRVGGLPQTILHLTYSPDGRYLAAALAGKRGVRVYQTPTYESAGVDEDYGDNTNGAAFDRANRLATVSYDNFIRLYAASGEGALRLLAKKSVEGGDRPYSVSFSPDGSRLAVGFGVSVKVAVLSSGDLSSLYAPDMTGVSKGYFSAVTWSADGKTLYAGGYAHSPTPNYERYIRVWADGGRGAYRDVPAAGDTIIQLLPLKSGGIVYGTLDPAFGVIDAGGKRTLHVTSSIADYRSPRQDFLLSPDGTSLLFTYEFGSKTPARFSLTERKLDTAPQSFDDLRPPISEVEGLRVTDWNNNPAPKLNGTLLNLKELERAQSVALAPDASAFLLGADFNLRVFDRIGLVRWNVVAPGAAWAVNISADGRLAVVAYADGTIRWHSMKDGRELLAFFPHADRKRWVLWTPSGYYDASPGGEDLIGWHVNNDKDSAADFFPVAQFRSTFYRPDVVSKILGAGDEQLALRQANEETGRKTQDSDVARVLPPVVEIISPQDSSGVNATDVLVRFNVRTPSGEAVTNVKFLVDGRPITPPAGFGANGDISNACLQKRGVGVRLKNESGLCEARLTLPEKDSLLSIIAENRFAASSPATVSLKWRGGAAANATASSAAGESGFTIKPKLYVLAIGVGNYANPDYKLTYPAKPPPPSPATLERQKNGLYREVVVRVLTDEKATKDDVLDGLDWIRKETTSKDVAMILLAGHGVNDSNGDYYYMPHNADVEKILRTGVSFSDIRRVVAALSGKTLFFVDTCHSGNVLGTARRALPDINGIVNELSSAENGAVVFASSTGKQYSLEKAEWQNGAFTKAVVEGFTGRADFNNQGRITINMLDLYISERVKELTGGQQTPTTAKPNTVPDFPVVLKQ